MQMLYSKLSLLKGHLATAILILGDISMGVKGIHRNITYWQVEMGRRYLAAWQSPERPHSSCSSRDPHVGMSNASFACSERLLALKSSSSTQLLGRSAT